MKDKLIELLRVRILIGNQFAEKLQVVSNINELEKLNNEFDEWDKINCKILEDGFEMQQPFRMYSGTSYLGNVYDDQNSFKGKRKRINELLPKKLGHLNMAVNIAQGANNNDLLPLDNVITQPYIEGSTKIIKMKKVFISHSSLDKEIIDPLVDLLVNIGIHHNQIFFSSAPAYGVVLGEDIFERLKKELTEDIYALFILSDNFYKSPVCLCEMGAVWIKANKHVPILIPPFDFKDVKGVFPNSLGFKLNDNDQLNSLKVDLEAEFNLQSLHPSIWEKKRNEYILKVSALII